MTDEELIARLRDDVNGEHDMTPHGADVLQATDRIEALIAERDREHTAAENFAIKLDEFSAYINRLKADNEALIAERDEAWKRAAYSEKMWGGAEVKLAKAVEIGNKMAHSIKENYYLYIEGDWRKVAAEVKGETK